MTNSVSSTSGMSTSVLAECRLLEPASALSFFHLLFVSPHLEFPPPFRGGAAAGAVGGCEDLHSSAPWSGLRHLLHWCMSDRSRLQRLLPAVFVQVPFCHPGQRAVPLRLVSYTPSFTLWALISNAFVALTVCDSSTFLFWPRFCCAAWEPHH